MAFMFEILVMGFLVVDRGLCYLADDFSDSLWVSLSVYFCSFYNYLSFFFSYFSLNLIYFSFYFYCLIRYLCYTVSLVFFYFPELSATSIWSSGDGLREAIYNGRAVVLWGRLLSLLFLSLIMLLLLTFIIYWDG